MSLNHRFSCAAVCTLLFSTLLAGCGSKNDKLLELAALSNGNWQFSSAAPAASRLPGLSGELSGSALAATGIFHSNLVTACVAPATAIELSGSAANENGVLTLTGGLAGGTLTVTGTLAADGKSLSNATYTVNGGTCAFGVPAVANGQNFSPISGNYNGSFSDPSGNVINIAATLTQTPASDTDGNFQLSGTGTFPSNPCFSSPVSIANSQVTGGSFSVTYADNTTNNTVTANGTFSTDGTTLTVTSWTLAGSCGPDAGMGLLTKQ